MRGKDYGINGTGPWCFESWQPRTEIVLKRHDAYQQKVTKEHLLIPVLNINMDRVANKKISGARPHMIYQNTLYKGLDVTR